MTIYRQCLSSSGEASHTMLYRAIAIPGEDYNAIHLDP
jgi:hypothetical protein